MIRPATCADAEAMASLYNPYILETSISFEEAIVSAEEFAQRVIKVQQAGLPWLVYEREGDIVGYAYATKWRERSAYRSSVESSIYLRRGESGKGYAQQLYGALIEQLRTLDVHAVIGGIAQPNEASVRLHEKLGFERVAMFRQVGRKFDRWIDVGYWQLLLS